jgi:hypothetical protein
MWLLQLHQDIIGKDISPLLINCDSQGARNHITTGIIKARTKHIDVCYHNSRDLYAGKIVDHSVMHTNENAADILTKVDERQAREIHTGYGAMVIVVGFKVVSLFGHTDLLVSLWMAILRLW